MAHPDRVAVLHIKQVAERSGFSASTLRYYEEIGLLQPADRSAAGYRLYDQRSIDRLAFIARAKQLGCNLEEIAELATVWDGGRCGPVQDHLHAAVLRRIEQAEAQAAELLRFAEELRRAAAELQVHRPDGPCDERCGCLADPDGSSTIKIAMPTMRGRS